MTGSSTLRSTGGTKTSLLDLSARPIRGAASAATPAPAVLSKSRLRIPHLLQLGTSSMSERALRVFRSTLVLLRPDVHQILYAKGVPRAVSTRRCYPDVDPSQGV